MFWNAYSEARQLVSEQSELLCFLERIMFKISKGYDHVTKSIRLPVPMAKELEQLAEENHISLNQLVNQCISFALEHQSDLDEDELAESREK